MSVRKTDEILLETDSNKVLVLKILSQDFLRFDLKKFCLKKIYDVPFGNLSFGIFFDFLDFRRGGKSFVSCLLSGSRGCVLA